MDRKRKGGIPKMPGHRQGPRGDSAPRAVKAAFMVGSLEGGAVTSGLQGRAVRQARLLFLFWTTKLARGGWPSA